MGETMKHVSINGRLIGEDQPPFVVAEISANHNGSIKNALNLISAAKDAGADAVKLQTYTPDTLTIKSNKPDFIIKGGIWDKYSLYELYKEAHTPFEWHEELFDHARELGITCFSSPFDETAVDLLEDLNTPAYKIASFEIIDLPLIKYVAQTGKPMIISTGLANVNEIQEAIDTARENGCTDLILLHCISSYPAPIAESNLKIIPDMANRFSVVSGLSDHTLGITASISAVALGACFIEKHFIDSRKNIGPDSSFSLEPEELSDLCRYAKEAWQSLGSINYERKKSENENSGFRRSIYFIADASVGDRIDKTIIRSVRPGFGLPPKFYDKIIGRRLIRNVEKGDPVTWDDID
mgnify:FL=1